MKKVSQKEAEERVYKRCKDIDCRLVDDNFVFVGSKMRLKFICNKDNYGSKGEWNTTYNNFIYHKKGCSKCSNKLEISQEEAEERVSKRCKEIDCRLKEPFIMNGMKTILHLICNKDNYGVKGEWVPTYNNFINNRKGCPKCFGNDKIYQEEADKKVLDRCKEIDCSLLKPFIMNGVYTRIYLVCNKDNYGYKEEWSPTYASFINKKAGCPKCFGNDKITQEEAEEKVYKRCNVMNYYLRESFIMNGYKTKIPLICLNHKHEWSPSYNSFIFQEKGCPVCKQSKGELYIRGYLEKNYNNLFVRFRNFLETASTSRAIA